MKNLTLRIKQYRADGKNLFSSSEAVTVAFMNPDLYQGLMPGDYIHDPLRAFFNVLDDEQRLDVMKSKKVIPDHEDGGYCLWEGDLEYMISNNLILREGLQCR